VSAAVGVPPFINPIQVAFSPDANLAYVTDAAVDYFFAVDTATNTATQIINTAMGGFTIGVAFQPFPLPPVHLYSKKEPLWSAARKVCHFGMGSEPLFSDRL
jgi:hypothetical protein